MKLQRPAGFERLFRTLRFLIFVAISSGVISSRVALAVTDEVQVFRDAFVASDFAKVAELIEQYRKSSKPLPKDEDGKTLLQRNFKQAFIAAGIDVNVRNNAGLTPLHFAALAGNTSAIEMLIANGAEPSARTASLYWYRSAIVSAQFGKGEEVPAGSTPLDLARLQYNRTKWSMGRHKPALELLQQIQRMKRQ